MKIKSIFTVLFTLFILSAGKAQIKSQQECIYDGQFSSSNIRMPAELDVNEKDEIVITVKNNGTCIWHPRDIELVVTLDKGPGGGKIQRDELLPTDAEALYPGTTLPGESSTLAYKIQAPYYVGLYTLHFQLHLKGKPFGDLGVKTLKVIAPKR